MGVGDMKPSAGYHDDPLAGLRHLRSTALVLIDMQNAYCGPEGTFARLGRDIDTLRQAIPGCQRLLAAARSAGICVIHVTTAFRPDYLDGGLIFNEIRPAVKEAAGSIQGSHDTQVIDELKPRPQELVVTKIRYSAFYSLLPSVLVTNRIGTLVLCGTTTNVCVESTARDAAQRDYHTYVVRDATSELDPEKHEHALTTMQYGFARIVNVDDISAAWAVG